MLLFVADARIGFLICWVNARLCKTLCWCTVVVAVVEWALSTPLMLVFLALF